LFNLAIDLFSRGSGRKETNGGKGVFSDSQEGLCRSPFPFKGQKESLTYQKVKSGLILIHRKVNNNYLISRLDKGEYECLEKSFFIPGSPLPILPT